MTDPLDIADRLFRQGVAAVRDGDFAAAIEAFRESAAAHSGHAPTWLNLGSCYAELGRHGEAVGAYRRALALDGSLADCWAFLGSSLTAAGDWEGALAAFGRALAIEPDNVPANEEVARHHFRTGDLARALDHMSRLVRRDPGNSEALSFLGTILLQLRSDRQARQAFELAVERDPDNDPARAQLMFLIAKDADWAANAANRQRIPQLGLGERPISPFLMIAFDDDPQRQRRRAELYSGRSFAGIVPLPAAARPTARPRRLRIGYFSADFRDHATMYLAARLFELHDRERFEIVAYSYGRDDGSAIRRRAVDSFDRFHDVRTMLAPQIAAQARADAIDIAVDLKGYTGQQRLEILAHRPAPVQIGYLGYPGTTGADFIDYLIADDIVVDAAGRPGISEALIRLPGCYQVNDDTRAVPGGRRTRADERLPEHGFVWCCFNAAYKIGEREFALWVRLLGALDGSVLWLLDQGATAAANLRAAARAHGVDPARLVFAPRAAYRDHLERIGLADLVLDTFACNAHTTASDALWCGVPLVTLPGRAFPARVAASLLHAAGLAEFVAADEEDYARKALDYARSPDTRARVRSKLAARDSRLFDSAATARAIERGYDLAFQAYVEGRPPRDIAIA